jgi:hypothetical protein
LTKPNEFVFVAAAAAAVVVVVVGFAVEFVADFLRQLVLRVSGR